MKRNDRERTMWIMNDEGLYNWYLRSHRPMSKFIRENRKEIDEAIDNVLTNKKPAHYLAYGGSHAI